MKKTKLISCDIVVQDHLRVCYLNRKNKFNCGVCEKCLRTMVALKVCGNLEKFKTFPTKIDLNILSKLKIDGKNGAIFHLENLEELKRLNIEPEIQKILESKIENAEDKKESLLLKFMKKIWFIDYYYFRGVLYKILNINRY